MKITRMFFNFLKFLALVFATFIFVATFFMIFIEGFVGNTSAIVDFVFANKWHLFIASLLVLYLFCERILFFIKE